MNLKTPIRRYAAWVAVGCVAILVAAAGIQRRNVASTPFPTSPSSGGEACPAYDPPHPIGNETKLPTIAFVRAGYFYDERNYRQALATLDPRCLSESRTGQALHQAKRLIACLQQHDSGISWSVDSQAAEGGVRIVSDQATITEDANRNTSLLNLQTDLSSNPSTQEVRLETKLVQRSSQWLVAEASEDPRIPGPC